MGVDFRDLDNDGRPDLFITALANETFPFYRNLGAGIFADQTYKARIGPAAMPFSGWGAGAYDFDNDGHKDLFAAFGDVNNNTEMFSSGKSREPLLLLLNGGDGTFAPVQFGRPSLYRGGAFADLDGDGRVDVVVTRLGESPLILRNSTGTGNCYWIGLRLEGRRSNHVVTASEEQWNHVTTAVGYASSSEKAVHFGLGRDTSLERIEN